MILDFKMVMLLSVLLCVAIIHGTSGTYFPPVNNSPPIPGLAVRDLSNPPQKFNEPEDLPPNISQPREETFFQPDAKIDEERWYYDENPSRDRINSQSTDPFNRYYQSGEPAISPVATPIPDETFLAQSSSITKLNPTNARNVGDSDVFILEGDNERQYSPQRWVQVQIPAKRLIEVLNQDYGVPVATDTVKSIVAPGSYDIPSESQPLNLPINLVQVRQPSTVELQKGYTNFPKVYENVPSVKDIVGIPPLANVKKVVQQQIIQDVSPAVIPAPVPDQISPKNAFIVPPPPPPPLKGVSSPTKVISSVPVNVFPDPNVIVSSKNSIPDTNIVPGKNVVQQVRHVWIPTSQNTGKFITIPISGSINSDKSNNIKRFSVDSAPITVSDTWILNQDGPFPSFEQQKSVLPPVDSPIVQSGKVIFQNPTIVQVDEPPNPVAKIDSQKYQPPVYKNVASNIPIDIWPARNQFASSKVSVGYSPVITPDVSSSAIKSETVVSGKSNSKLLPPPQKSIITNTKSAFPPSIPSPTLEIVNGKPCPLPLPATQKSIIPPLNPGVIIAPRIISRQRNLPFARIIRVNRYPTGSYYLINKNIRPSYVAYPNQAIIQPPNAGLISVIQTKQLPRQFGKKIPTPLVQTQKIVPVQTKQTVSPLPVKQTAYTFVPRRVVLPIAPPKSSRIIYPPIQAIRYVYPWNAYSNPIFGKGEYVPQFGSFKVNRGSESKSSSSESSSENSSEDESSDSSEEKKQTKPKKEKIKKEKPKKEEKLKSEENSNSNESVKETESESKESSGSKEKESEENRSQKESKESMESSESQISLNLTKHETN